MLEKRVIAAYDSCIVNSEVPYAKLINSNVERLKDFGLIFVQAKELADYMLNKKDLEINSLRDKNVITANNLKDLYDKKIIISKNTVVTTLAKERAKENQIVFEEK